MARSIVASDAHLERNLTASLFRDIAPASEAAFAMPRMLQRYREPQQASHFVELPFELETLVLSALTVTAQSGSALLRWGLTCNYWHLRVRHHIEHAPEGQQFRRAFEHSRYTTRHGVTPVDHARDKIRWRAAEQLERWANDWWGSDHVDIHDEIMTQHDPVTMTPGHEIVGSPGFGQALAKRTGALTVLDFSSKSIDAECLIEAIRATPRGSYLALMLKPANYTLQDARRIAKAMAARPVLCFVEIGDDAFVSAGKAAAFDLNLLTACAEHAVDSCQFSLMYDVLNRDKAGQLADLIRTFRCGVTIEICANNVEAECMALILDAVMSCNQSCSARLSLHCKGSELTKAVGRMLKSTPMPSGIHVHYLNEAQANTDTSDPDQYRSSDSEIGGLLATLDWRADSADDEGDDGDAGDDSDEPAHEQ